MFLSLCLLGGADTGVESLEQRDTKRVKSRKTERGKDVCLDGCLRVCSGSSSYVSLKPSPGHTRLSSVTAERSAVYGVAARRRVLRGESHCKLPYEHTGADTHACREREIHKKKPRHRNADAKEKEKEMVGSATRREKKRGSPRLQLTKLNWVIISEPCLFLSFFTVSPFFQPRGKSRKNYIRIFEGKREREKKDTSSRHPLLSTRPGLCGVHTPSQHLRSKRDTRQSVGVLEASELLELPGLSSGGGRRQRILSERCTGSCPFPQKLPQSCLRLSPLCREGPVHLSHRALSRIPSLGTVSRTRRLSVYLSI